eukprot:GHRR01010546.1.p1 GENE.GHRR01010546.1~~GHRR01010546.1.p1  ORF type:complete len:143 (-),score=49.48 GHRR01010546.1:420-848(-)
MALCKMYAGTSHDSSIFAGRLNLQVLGHTKTVLVLLTSWAVLHEHMSLRKLSGMALAVAGMVAYGYFNSSSGSSSSSKPSSEGVPHLKARLSDSAPLLSRSSKSAQDLPTVVTAGMKNATAEKRMTAVGSSGNVTQITVIAR